jgi:hypothetical protein
MTWAFVPAEQEPFRHFPRGQPIMTQALPLRFQRNDLGAKARLGVTTRSQNVPWIFLSVT